MAKKVAITLVLFLAYAGIIAAIVAIVNQIFRSQGIATQATTFVLGVVLAVCFYSLWRWLCKRLDKIGASDKS